MTVGKRFIGPLPEEAYRQAGSEFHVHYLCDLAEVIGREGYGRNMAQIAFADTLEKLNDARTDKMTGLLTRDAFLEEVQTGVLKMRHHGHERKGDPDSALFLMLDIVELKKINEGGGHAAGDKAIQTTADFIRQICRLEDRDIAGRLGGDEFAIFMPYSGYDVSHEKMGSIITERIDRKRSLAQINGGVNAPAIRYRYTVLGPSVLLSVKELLVEADPKRPGATPVYSLPVE